MWENYGTLRQQYKPEADELGECVKYNFVVKEKVEVNYNTFLMRLERTDGCKVVVPLGRHVRIFGNVDGQEMSRSYTPVPSSLFGKLKLYDLTVTDSVCLMIKRYQDGNVSRYLTDREAGDLVHATNPLGDFDLKRLEMRDTFLLLAAGTGITPMLSLLVFLLDRRIKKSQFVRLMFFNKTQRDIPFRNQLEDIEKLDDRLRVDHVLSEPDADWVGMSGHVSKEMIDNALQEHLRDTGYTIRHVFVFVCGPNPFVALALHELGELGVVAEEQVHAFRG
ncbi:hypothetical protein NQ318_002782 [Aromia moschata]|uniref:NADH-cytochrome b5 reductase n=1 Tax=Aromia moschata TaxID=1265417 RepID=A0AAV8XW94_9CUCU|nr:hypothetical protein NQ318_002782 [Aromia moschata]